MPDCDPDLSGIITNGLAEMGRISLLPLNKTAGFPRGAATHTLLAFRVVSAALCNNARTQPSETIKAAETSQIAGSKTG